MSLHNLNNADVPVVLTVGGSDSSGGSGIQADLKTFSAFGVYGASALTCINAQSPNEVRHTETLDVSTVVSQIQVVSESYPLAAAKTGMLYNAEIIEAVAAVVESQGIPILVVDPVMVADSGVRLMEGDAVEMLCSKLLPVARVTTMNMHEAEIICGFPITNERDMKKAAEHIGEKFNVACIITGIPIVSDHLTDILYDKGEVKILSSLIIKDQETHGCGCAFSAALTACLALREYMPHAFSMSHDYISNTSVLLSSTRTRCGECSWVLDPSSSAISSNQAFNHALLPPPRLHHHQSRDLTFFPMPCITLPA